MAYFEKSERVTASLEVLIISHLFLNSSLIKIGGGGNNYGNSGYGNSGYGNSGHGNSGYGNNNYGNSGHGGYGGGYGGKIVNYC